MTLKFWFGIPGPKFLPLREKFSFRKQKNSGKSMTSGVLRKPDLKVQLCHLVVVGH